MCSTVLPYELIHAIFELAASESLHAMFTLLLVSRETHKWLEYQLYAKVELRCLSHRDRFERSRMARRDNRFFKSAVQQLDIGADRELLALCTKITHLYLQNFEGGHDWCLPPLRHLQSLKYLSIDGIQDNVPLDALPPKLKYLHCCYPGTRLVLPTTPKLMARCHFPSHVVLDFSCVESERVAKILPDLLRMKCSRLAIAVPRTHFLKGPSVDEIHRLRKQHHPRLFLVSTYPGSIFQNIMHCDQSLLLRFEFWDKMKDFLARKLVPA